MFNKSYRIWFQRLLTNNIQLIKKIENSRGINYLMVKKTKLIIIIIKVNIIEMEITVR